MQTSAWRPFLPRRPRESLRRRLRRDRVHLRGFACPARRSRRLGLRPGGRSRSRDQRRRPSDHGRGGDARRQHHGDHRSGSATEVRRGAGRHQGDPHSDRHLRHCAGILRRIRRHRPERHRQRGGDREPRRPGRSRHHISRGEARRAGARPVGHARRHHLWAVRAERGDAGGNPSARGDPHSRRHSVRRGRRCPRCAVAQGDLQRGDEPDPERSRGWRTATSASYRTSGDS